MTALTTDRAPADWADRFERWVVPEQPGHVRLPGDAVAATAPAPLAPPRTPVPAQRDVWLRLPADDTAALGARLPALLARAGTGSTVTVDLGQGRWTPAALGLLLTLLWRRVGPSGDVRLTGVPGWAYTSLARLGLTPDEVRAAVLGTAGATGTTVAPVKTPRRSSSHGPARRPTGAHRRSSRGAASPAA